jgi:hypothetical protein
MWCGFFSLLFRGYYGMGGTRRSMCFAVYLAQLLGFMFFAGKRAYQLGPVKPDDERMYLGWVAQCSFSLIVRDRQRLGGRMG